MYFYKSSKMFFLTLVVFVALTSLTYAQDKKVLEPPSSVGAANYYELTPHEKFISLGVKGYQQTTYYTCGPAAVMSLMRWHNMLTDADLTPATEMRIAGEMNAKNSSGTSTSDMVAWLEKNGFDVTEGEQGTVEMLMENLKKGIPTIILWSDWSGHFVLHTGYYPGYEITKKGSNTIIFADPSAGIININNPDGITTFNIYRFNLMWNNYSPETNIMHRGSYITAVPHKK